MPGASRPLQIAATSSSLNSGICSAHGISRADFYRHLARGKNDLACSLIPRPEYGR